MQQQPESTLPPSPEPPEASPPFLDPARWEDFEGFRETFLTHLTDARHNAACRAFAGFLYELVLEAPAFSQSPPERWVPHRVRGALADVRFLQGFFASLGEERRHVTMTPGNQALCQLAARQSRRLARIAEAVEAALEEAEA